MAQGSGSRPLLEESRMNTMFLCSMGSEIDGILNKLDKDTIIHVLSLLDTPKDLAHATCVCNLWRRYVIEGKLWKRLFNTFFPESGIYLDSESSAYVLLLRRLLSPPLQRTCISEPLHASSTDNLPHESVAQTLYPEPEYPEEEVPSYWSSKGYFRTSVPEMLTYRLVSDLCVVHDVKIQPYLATFQRGNPIYSARMIRFRIGYSRSARPRWSGLFDCILHTPQKADMDGYVWTYVSPTFPMAQENTVQTFRLPKPTLCIGGIFQVEFMGRVQSQEADGLYYICISHVHVTGRPLSDFKFEGTNADGQFVLKHLTQKEKSSSLVQTCLGSGLEQNDGSLLLEQLRSNRLILRNNHSVVDLLLRYLLTAGLLKEGDLEDD
eukprot:c21064_g1_i1 orf=223-1359(-)